MIHHRMEELRLHQSTRMEEADIEIALADFFAAEHFTALWWRRQHKNLMKYELLDPRIIIECLLHRHDTTSSEED